MLYDVVLIDTAGRRHNDARLMSSLTKFGQLANPDKIFMVGEALVGTDSVAQARNFAKEFVDTKGVMRNGGVGMDGFIISKCDTVGDMVGTLVSMVHATGEFGLLTRMANMRSDPLTSTHDRHSSGLPRRGTALRGSAWTERWMGCRQADEVVFHVRLHRFRIQTVS
jgi:hypothetical protein